MRDLLDDLDRWRRKAVGVALARVVDVDGSGPREPGAAMAIAVDVLGGPPSQVVGSVSGGCVEGAVVAEALEVLDTGDSRLVSFGYSDDEAFAVGLTCGGTVHLFLEPLASWPDGMLDQLSRAIRAEQPVGLATMIEGAGQGAKLLTRPGEPPIGSLGDPDLDRVVTRDALGELAAGTTGIRHYGAHGEARESTVSVFVESFAPPPQMLIFGAVDFTGALVRVAKVLGYRVTVCDAREVFATHTRFPQADEVVVDWPDRLLDRLGSTLTPRDAVCVLTHDAKFDVPALTAALRTRAGYIGAMGSRRTHADRLTHLREAGVDNADLARVRAPIGLDIGARTPEETAISICAEIIADETGRTRPLPLHRTTGPIHG